MEIKSEDLAYDFLKFCIERPHLRFWQALNAWSNKAYIYVSKKPIDSPYLADTYYFSNKKVKEDVEERKGQRNHE